MGTISDFLYLVEGTQTNVEGVFTGENGKVIARGIDTTPRLNSDNLITSEGVKSVLYGLGDSVVSAPSGDWSAIGRTGFYAGNVNAPVINTYAFGVAIRLTTTGNNFSMLQIATLSGAGGLYFRTKTPGDQLTGWGDWKKIAAET